MIIEIQYRDKKNWESITGLATNWTNYSKKFKKDRVQPWYLTPEVVTDNWNGKEFDVQHKRWDVYFTQIQIKESEKHALSQIKSCSDIKIIQYTEDSSSTILTQTYTLDTTKSDYIEISDPEKIANTSSAIVDIIFRTNRTIIDKALPIDNTNKISFSKGTQQWELKAESNSISGKLLSLDESTIIALNGTTLSKYTRVGNSYVLNFSSTISQSNNTGAICKMSDSRVAIMSDISLKLVAYDIGTSSFTQVGNEKTISIFAISSRFSCTYLSDDRITISYNDEDLFGTIYQYLLVYDFDGTDFTQDGSTTSIVGNEFSQITTLATTKIAVIDSVADVIESYDWNGTNFVVDISTSVTIVGNLSIVALTSTRIAYLVNNGGSGTLESYTLTTSWGLESSVAVTMPSAVSNMALINSDELYIPASTPGFYSYLYNTYYTDYDVLDWVKQTEDILTEWQGTPDIIIQSISKIGKECVIYVKTTDFDALINDFKNTKTTYINSTEVDEMMYESLLIGEDLWKVVFRGVSDKTIVNKADPVSNTYSIVINSNTYYTDFPILVGEKKIDDIKVAWFDGSEKIAQSTYKKTWSMLFFFTQSTIDNFLEDYYASGSKTINGQTTSECEIQTTPNGEDYYKVVVTGVIDTIVTPFDLGANHDYSLSIDNGGGAVLYYTDYAPEYISETPEISTTKNQTGVNSTTKSISKQVKQIQFWLDETDSAALKLAFESVGTILLNPGSVPVLENREITFDKIGVDLYNVKVNCLIDATITTN